MVDTLTRPVNYGLTISQGATFRLLMTWKDEDGSPIDLGSATGELIITRLDPPRNGVRPRVDVYSFTTDTDDGMTLGSDGTILLEAPAEDTELFDWDTPATKAVYNLYITLAGDVTRLMEGNVILHPKA